MIKSRFDPKLRPKRHNHPETKSVRKFKSMWRPLMVSLAPFIHLPGFLVRITLAIVLSGAISACGLFPLGEKSKVSRLPDKPVRFKTKGDLPERPPLILELGDPFLAPGKLKPGFELPTGAVWQPRLWVYGTFRSAVQTYDNGVADRASEWVNRFDLFANLQLTGTEKLIVGIRPLDQNRFNAFSGYAFEGDGAKDEFDADVRTAFFEGDIGSLFPKLDPQGFIPIDVGFSVGRQPLVFQDGILINDTVDALGIVRNNVRLPGFSNIRISGVWGWNELDSRNDRQAYMFGLFLSADTHISTVDFDAIYVEEDRDDGSSFHAGVATTQRIGHLNTTFRVLGSYSEAADTPRVADGVLLSSEVSWTPTSSDDIVYVNTFLAIETFTQAGREPIVGGPLAPLGILFASPNLGNFLSELSSRANEVVGGAVGYQAFWDNHRRNLVLEIAGRKNTSDQGFDDVAFGFQFQQAFLRRILLQFEGYYAVQEDRDDGYGGRTELLVQF